MRGDLDWILMRALEKDRTRRYETANGLAAEILRHINNEPVVARPPGKLYRFRNMVRRNKVAFLAVSAAITALVIGLTLAWCSWTAAILQARKRRFASRWTSERNCSRRDTRRWRWRRTIWLWPPGIRAIWA